MLAEGHSQLLFLQRLRGCHLGPWGGGLATGARPARSFADGTESHRQDCRAGAVPAAGVPQRYGAARPRGVAASWREPATSIRLASDTGLEEQMVLWAATAPSWHPVPGLDPPGRAQQTC